MDICVMNMIISKKVLLFRSLEFPGTGEQPLTEDFEGQKTEGLFAEILTFGP